MKRFTALVLLLASTVVVPAQAAYTTTIVNFDNAGNQVTRYDTAGDALDAHDGDLALFGDTYYLYGTSYDCGYGLQVNGTRWCGFKVYTSPDLVHWTDHGFLFEPNSGTWQGRCAPPTYGCYRPHVVFNAQTGKYVLWINGYDNRSGFHVFTSDSPIGPFTEVAEPTLAFMGTGPGFNNGDHDLFVDDDGTAYLAYTDIRGGHSQVIERLNTSYTSGAGTNVRIGPGGTEAPSMFRRGNVYYYIDGPNCPYCGGTETRYRTASNPLGPWSGSTTINGNSCGGQPSFVAKLGSTYLYGSDLWNHLMPNQGQADYYWAPLTFAADGRINPFACANSVTVNLETGSAGSQTPMADQDQADGVSGFRTWCDIKSGWQRMQTFVAGRSGTLSTASYTTFREGNPNAPLEIDLYQVNSALQTVGPRLASTAIAASSVGWAPRNLPVATGVAVTAGTRYGIVARSATTTGCYGMTYNDSAPYPGGGEAYSANGGTSYVAEGNRSSKFWTAVGRPNLARGAGITMSSTFTGFGWAAGNINDGRRTSDPGSMGWSSNDSTGSDHAEWVRLGLAAATTVSRVDLYPRADLGNAGHGFPVEFAVEVSTDGTTWTPVLTRTVSRVPGAVVQSFPFTPVTAQYVRIQMTKLRNTNPNDLTFRAQFAEVELY